MAKSNARHMAAKKNNIARNAGVAAVAGAALIGSVAPANAFAVATPAAVDTTPTLVDYASTTTYTTNGAAVENATATVKTQSSNTQNLEGKRAAIVAGAYDGIGGSYVWGGESYKAWDCSGFVSYVFAQQGINLTSYTYAMAGELTPTSNPQPGDIVFTNGYAHVGIYVGNGKMISALNPGQGTLETAVDGGGFMPVDGYYTVAGL